MLEILMARKGLIELSYMAPEEVEGRKWHKQTLEPEKGLLFSNDTHWLFFLRSRE